MGFIGTRNHKVCKQDKDRALKFTKARRPQRKKNHNKETTPKQGPTKATKKTHQNPRQKKPTIVNLRTLTLPLSQLLGSASLGHPS